MQAHNLATVEGLGAELKSWTNESSLLEALFQDVITADKLNVVNRPGAWLLDCLHTQQLAILDPERHRNVDYLVVSNAALSELHEQLVPHMFTPNMQRPPVRGLNYRGNQFEYLVWLALEAEKPQIALAIPRHARNMRRPWVWDIPRVD